MPQNIVLYSGADGGDAPFGGKGGEGILAQSGLNSNSIATVNTFNPSLGSFPAGGGGATNFNSNSFGANGLVILHW